jgi:hypothetical protein
MTDDQSRGNFDAGRARHSVAQVMKSKPLFLPIAVVAALIVYAVTGPKLPKCSGFSFDHPGGDCVVWYARDGDQILDMVIAPRATFATCFKAGSSRLRTGETDVAFGSTHKAYVFEADAWRVEALDGLKESDLPEILELQECTSTSEIARRVLGR